ncbi:translin-associated factor X-interacting protein 1-like [Watersipora subatra]|uniref:translin-associated factor X-interacting protein 1-like n=1 Tax=Watersipora subatra TaxID=2589382 RepID=UPI00355B0E4C
MTDSGVLPPLAITTGEQDLTVDNGSKLPRLVLSRENSDDRLVQYRYSPVSNPFKDGMSFTVKGAKHVLPPPGNLKPFMDTKSGTMDTWPAHATGMSGTRQVCLSKHKDLVVVDEEKLGKPQMTPKPKFLHNLESFLKKELRTLGVTKVEPNELRLQAHREVFEYLINEFLTYKPLLSSIKREYEMMLTHNREHIRHLEPLKQVLITTTERCDQRIAQLKSKDQPEVALLKGQREKLISKIEEMKVEQLKSQAVVEDLQEKLSKQYGEYRDQADARKMLVLDINELRYRQEDLLMQQQAANQYASGEDPTTLRIALKRAKYDEGIAQANLKEMVEKHADVMPRRDFESLQKELEALKEHHQERCKDIDVLKNDHAVLNEAHITILKEKDQYYQESEQLRQAATPRPDWERAADVIPGGIQRWQELSQGLSSDEIVGVLLKELSRASGGEFGAPEYFEGQGEEDDVPVYLRYQGQVRNRHIGKKETAKIIKDIWKEKSLLNPGPDIDGEERARRVTMPEFLVQYLETQFPLHQMVVEWCYNIHDSCQRYSHDDRIGLFLGILTEDIDEEVYYDQMKAISSLFARIQQVASDQEDTSVLSRDIFKLALSDYFEEKEENDVEELMKAAEQELYAGETAETIQYNNLFIEDDEGKFGPFVEELKRQLEKDKVAYISDIMKELDSKRVSYEDLQRAIELVDPEIEPVKLDALLFWAYKVTDREQLENASILQDSDLEQRLINGNIKRSGPKA